LKQIFKIDTHLKQDEHIPF